MLTLLSQRWIWLGMAFIALSAVGRLSAQEAGIDDEEEAKPVVVRRAARFDPADRVQYIDKQFDRWGLGRATAGKTKAGLERLLEIKIKWAVEKHELSAENVRKLELAGRADIKRFMDLVDEQKQRLTVAEMVNIAPPAKKDRRVGPVLGRYRQAVEPVATFLRKELNLTNTQHELLVDLILNSTAPLSRYGELESYAVLHGIATIPKFAIRVILNDWQYDRLWALCEVAKAQEYRLVAEQYLSPQNVTVYDNTREGLRQLDQDFSSRRVKVTK
jgi:hypothetical protein